MGFRNVIQASREYQLGFQWVSNSANDPNAIEINRKYSLVESLAWPSAIFEGAETADL